MDHASMIDRLVYWTECPVDVGQARRLLGCSAHDAPPPWCFGYDFGVLSTEQQRRLDPWVKRIGHRRIAGLDRQAGFFTFPHVVYVFGWPRSARRPDPVAAARRVGELAVTEHLPRPAIGVGPPVVEWIDLRRALQRATVGSRLAGLHGSGLCGPRDVERFLSGPRKAARRSATLLGAIARPDRATAEAEAREVAENFTEAYLSPLATLRVKLINLLLQCGESARAAGLVARQVDRWTDHTLRNLWQMYSPAMLTDLITDSIGELTAMVDAATDERLPRAVASARAVLIATWNEDLSAVQLAREAGLSAAQLSRLFNRHMGCSIPLFRNRLRIERAQQTLAETDKPVTQVAFECGFNNLTHFHRVFRELVGGSPTSYRKLLLDD